ncbi:glycosyltransferase family 4 protein [Geminocystis sp. NIES-3709]|uniref:glycosyltransferase family 4 protein n=1 Tax=Geminocystis sp. NIES-3709 TaxID=1617448 RepID=UPI0005FC4264|nr:glycosyltransferase family 4 protein [Geminocystis sp. NIES-3709]BAQ64217.1 glycosyl transferase [Geminocystis sp. NIES-3709]
MIQKQQGSAIYYSPDGYNTQGKRLLGRQSAGEGFLKAYIESHQGDTLYCYGDSDNDFRHFQQLVIPWLKKSFNFQLITKTQSYQLAEVGNLYLPGPSLADFAWQRRFYDQRGYSICGITHTIASKEAIGSIGNLLMAPIQPWDALICTSNAVKVAVEKILYDWGEYLGQRFNSKINLDLQLPIIPLGVDAEKFQFNSEFRNTIRERLNIAEEDIVVLFVGRLIFYAKAHPVPMYLALEKAVKQISHKGKIVLIQCGWFEDEREEASFIESAKEFAPSISYIFLNGKNPEIRQKIWSAGDIFISLADNIQETFGLTPIEAMAAGLPVIVSDWNGYQESIRHEIDGFRISTMIPSENNALDLAHNYHIDQINYSTYIAHACFATMIDIDECTTALVKLIDNPDMRKKMGENGKQRVQDIYDWQNVIKSYHQLWKELEEIRNIKEMSVPIKNGNPPYPLCDDPFNLFNHYSTAHLSPEINLKLSSIVDDNFLKKIRTMWTTNFGNNYRLSNQIIDRIINDLKTHKILNVAYFIAVYGQENSNILIRTLMYLLKFNILIIDS